MRLWYVPQHCKPFVCRGCIWRHVALQLHSVPTQQAKCTLVSKLMTPKALYEESESSLKYSSLTWWVPRFLHTWGRGTLPPGRFSPGRFHTRWKTPQRPGSKRPSQTGPSVERTMHVRTKTNSTRTLLPQASSCLGIMGRIWLRTQDWQVKFGTSAQKLNNLAIGTNSTDSWVLNHVLHWLHVRRAPVVSLSMED